jgi:halocyanin-like protein
MNRRDFLRTAAAGAGGSAAAAGAAAPAAAQETTEGGGGGGGGGGEPDFGGWLDDVGNFNGVEDMRGNDQVTVQVGTEANGGPYGYTPAAVHVDAGTTIQFEWTGNQEHNVVHQDGDFESDLYTAAGVNYEYTFEEDGIYNYYCTPHRGLGMKGSVVVGSDYPTAGGGDGGGGEPRVLPDGAKTIGVATGFVMVATLGLAYFFMKYGGDYGDFED